MLLGRSMTSRRSVPFSRIMTSTLSWAYACGVASSMLNRSEEPAIILFIYVGLFVMDKSVYLFLKSETALQPYGAVGGVVYPVVDDSRFHFHAEVGGDVEIGQFGIHIGIDDGQQVYSDEGEDT